VGSTNPFQGYTLIVKNKETGNERKIDLGKTLAAMMYLEREFERPKSGELPPQSTCYLRGICPPGEKPPVKSVDLMNRRVQHSIDTLQSILQEADSLSEPAKSAP